MARKVGVFGLFALAVLIFLIWKDPASAATTVGDFLSAVFDFLGQVLRKLLDFVSGLAQ